MNLLDYLIMLLYFAVMIGAGYWGLTRGQRRAVRELAHNLGIGGESSRVRGG